MKKLADQNKDLLDDNVEDDQQEIEDLECFLMEFYEAQEEDNITVSVEDLYIGFQLWKELNSEGNRHGRRATKARDTTHEGTGYDT